MVEHRVTTKGRSRRHRSKKGFLFKVTGEIRKCYRGEIIEGAGFRLRARLVGERSVEIIKGKGFKKKRGGREHRCRSPSGRGNFGIAWGEDANEEKNVVWTLPRRIFEEAACNCGGSLL